MTCATAFNNIISVIANRDCIRLGIERFLGRGRGHFAFAGLRVEPASPDRDPSPARTHSATCKPPIA